MSLTKVRWYAPPSQRSLARRLAVGATVATAGLLLLSGCGAGKDAQTTSQHPVTDGIAADSGTIGIRNAGVQAPDSGTSYDKGSSANLQLVIVNNGTAPDKLVSVTSTSASSAVLSLSGSASASSSGSAESGSAASSSGSASSAAGASGAASSSSATTPGTSASSSSASASASSGASASPSASGSASNSAATSEPITVPADNSVKIGFSSDGPTITLVGLSQQLFPAQVVDVTFTFASGATIQAQLPVQLTSGSVSAPTIQVSPTDAG